MAKLINGAGQRQRDGVAKALAHVARMYQQGLASHDELERARMYALRDAFTNMDVETYKTARENGDWDKYEQLMNDPRSGTQAEQEAVMRKAAAHFLAETALTYQPTDQADHDRVMRETRDHMGQFIDMSGADSDPDLAVWETKTKLDLGEKVSAPVEEPSWSKPLQRLSDDDPDVKAFKLRDENTPGTRRWNDATDAYGEKRDAKGRYIPKNVLREDADKIPARKNSTFEQDVKRAKETGDDRGDGMTIDKSIGIVSANEMADIIAHEQSQASPSAPAPEQPVILPNPSEA